MQPTPADLLSRRYYQLVFIWMKDPPKFGRYLEQAAPVVRRYGGDLERMLVPDTLYAEGMRKPDVVNIVYYDDREAFAALGRDPEFQKLLHLRAEAIDMASVEGLPVGGTVEHGELGKRTYLVEVARFGARGASGYRHYEEQAEPVMHRYGYRVERVLSPDTAVGFPFQPDVVKIAYFDGPDGMARMHEDPAHHRMERELYPAAVQQSVWVIGRVHPATPG